MLYYISTADLPGKQANTVQQVRMCEAFQRVGVDVCLVHPSHGDLQRDVTWDDLAGFYGLETQFEVQTVPTLKGRLDTVPQVGVLSMLGAMTARLVRWTLLDGLDSDDIVYGRNYYGMFPFNELRRLLPSKRQPTVAFEHHDEISAHLKQRFFSTIDGCVTTSHRLKERNCAALGLTPDRAFVGYHGVDIEVHERLDREIAREQVGFTEEQSHIVYTGHLYPRKGVDTLVQAATEIDASLCIVGGYQEDIERIRTTADDLSNVTFTGFVEPASIPAYQVAADVLVAPYAPSTLELNMPLKLFEYLAASRPVVVSDMEMVREVVSHEENCLLFEPGNAAALRETLKRVLAEEALAERLSRSAREEARQYSWERRAERILSFVGD